MAKSKCDWKGIADILVELPAGKPVAIHSILWGWLYPAYYGDKVTPEQVSIMASYYNAFQNFEASTPGLRTALAFAESYNNIPSDYIPDGLHLSDVGSAAVVDLLRKTVFEPSVLGSPAINNADVNCASAPQ